MRSADSEPAEESVAPAPQSEQEQRRAARIQAKAQQLARRAQDERGRHRSVDAVFEMAERDSEVGGGIIAGALAYRLFIWLLPLALDCRRRASASPRTPRPSLPRRRRTRSGWKA